MANDSDSDSDTYIYPPARVKPVVIVLKQCPAPRAVEVEELLVEGEVRWRLTNRNGCNATQTLEPPLELGTWHTSARSTERMKRSDRGGSTWGLIVTLNLNSDRLKDVTRPMQDPIDSFCDRSKRTLIVKLKHRNEAKGGHRASRPDQLKRLKFGD
ncbi:hypothetical protein BU26DRAFT_499458 [Trematosphaeria pertusa]|uniref:Uncharacterized protein n=1 Tax=Trematosphaeria pertusa TaxID=390896 RepID=A0A6A6J222_9PLEO|nr:uncharacterized protein BU26DRAFT_499458 [Trematosphaeria pertusa]KAF2256844.1 hypothetical protein BU26DRAFT_499458 [Trematosphaeria pertusa]